MSPPEDEQHPPVSDARLRRRHHHLPTVAVALAGAALTAAVTWAASSANNDNNERLLRVQVRQTASTLSAVLPSLQPELVDALQIETATRSVATFRYFAATKVAAKGGYDSMSLWRRTPGGARLVAFVGRPPRLVADGAATAFFSALRPSRDLQLTRILPGSPPSIGTAEWPPGDTSTVVYAEVAIPAKKRVALPPSSPYRDLNFALYLGAVPARADLIETTAALPYHGPSAVVHVPFGDTVITVVGSPTTQLSGALSAALAWIVVAVGALVTTASAAVVEYASRRRRLAEVAASDVAVLYSQQRSIAETLQRALLPERLPSIGGMEIAARYLAGVNEVDVGGDWYDVVPTGEGRFIFVVGDVSGRGIHAATVMGALHYSSRAFAIAGYHPGEILVELARTLSISADGHFATVLCGEVDVTRRQVTLANAGHLAPVVVDGEDATTLTSRPSSPIGITHRTTTEPTVHVLHAHSTLIAYTDGLVERRRESLDDGMARLRAVVNARRHLPLEQLLSELLAEMTPNGPEDDIAVIGMRWTT